MSPYTDYILIPGTKYRIYAGSLVKLKRIPDKRWVLCCGCYNYDSTKHKGWYFKSADNSEILPLCTGDISSIQVIQDRPIDDLNNSIITHIPAPPEPSPSPSPQPNPPSSIIYTKEDKLLIDRSMITVPTLDARDALDISRLVDGKICKVNNANGQLIYYSWDASNTTWVEATLGYKYMTREEVEEAISVSGKGIVDVEWSDSKGALIITNYDKTTFEASLNGVAHDPVFIKDDITLTIPVYGRDDVVVKIPSGRYLENVRYESNYLLPDSSYGPALVFTINDGGYYNEIVVGTSAISAKSYSGVSTNSINVNVDSANCSISAEAKIAETSGNALSTSVDGLYVDISGKADNKDITAGYLLVADGLGGFTYADPGVQVFTEGDVDSIGEKGVVTANVISAAIKTAIQDPFSVLSDSISALSSQTSILEDRLDNVYHMIGGSTLSSDDSKVLIATEAAVKAALSWNDYKL